MNWKHIMVEQPKDGENIVQCDPPYEGHYPIGMRKYYHPQMDFNTYIGNCIQYDFPLPNFYWISADEFPFPIQPERSKREDTSNSDAVL